MHITRCLTLRPHNSGEAPCSFTMAPCVVVERLEGKQQCSRAPVGEHAEVQAQDAECGCHEQQEVNKKRPKPRNSPSHNHDSTAPTQHPPIHPVQARSGRQPRRPLPRKDSHFRHFSNSSVFMYTTHLCVCVCVAQHISVYIKPIDMCATTHLCPYTNVSIHTCAYVPIYVHIHV